MVAKSRKSTAQALRVRLVTAAPVVRLAAVLEPAAAAINGLALGGLMRALQQRVYRSHQDQHKRGALH